MAFSWIIWTCEVKRVKLISKKKEVSFVFDFELYVNFAKSREKYINIFPLKIIKLKNLYFQMNCFKTLQNCCLTKTTTYN